MKSIVKILSFTISVFAVAVVMADSPAIQQVILDDHTVVSVPVASNRVTTINFPGAITAIDGAGITVDGKTPGRFQLAHTQGSAFLSVRALMPKASANLNIRWHDRTYVFELFESDAPVLSLNLATPPTPEEADVGHAPEVSPVRLLALLDKARAFPLLKVQQPESVAGVDFTSYDGKPLVSDFNDYAIQIEEAFRFNAEDTLVFRLAITNRIDTPLIYQPDSFALRAGNRLYPQSVSDANGSVPPKGQSTVYFAVTGTPDGGRNELSLRNAFTVLVTRLSPPRRRPSSPPMLRRPSRSFTQRPAMKPRDFLNFFKTKSGKLVAFGALFAIALVVFSVVRKHHTSAEDVVAVTCAGHQCHRQTASGAIRRPAHAEAFNPPPPKPEPTPSSPGATSSVASEAIRTPSATVARCSREPAATARAHQFICRQFGGGCAPVPKKLSAVFAPFGRLIPCETVITVDSASIQTPIVGLVTEDVYFGGRLVIPAGTEIHGTAQTDHQRERIASGNSWTLVWQNGMEMQLKAIALDREFENDTNQTGWAITDGSAGLRGEIIKSDNLADIKLFAATFLSGAAGALTEKQQTVFGPINSPTLNNAPFAECAQAVLQSLRPANL